MTGRPSSVVQQLAAHIESRRVIQCLGTYTTSGSKSVHTAALIWASSAAGASRASAHHRGTRRYSLPDLQAQHTPGRQAVLTFRSVPSSVGGCAARACRVGMWMVGPEYTTHSHVMHHLKYFSVQRRYSLCQVRIERANGWLDAGARIANCRCAMEGSRPRVYAKPLFVQNGSPNGIQKSSNGAQK